LPDSAALAAETAAWLPAGGKHEVLVGKVLSSIGRVPMVEGFGLEVLNLPLDARGVPPFDPHTTRVGNLPVFLAGDVTGERPVLHEATDEGKIAGYTAAHVDHAPWRFHRKMEFYVTFCDPNIIAVGDRCDQIASERSAVAEVRFSTVSRARALGEAHGVLRLYAARASDRVLGSEMIAPRGEHLGHLLAWAYSPRRMICATMAMRKTSSASISLTASTLATFGDRLPLRIVSSTASPMTKTS